MSKNRNRRSQDLAATTQAREGELLVKDQGGQSMAFTFGDPVPVLDGRAVSYTHLTLPTKRIV